MPPCGDLGSPGMGAHLSFEVSELTPKRLVVGYFFAPEEVLRFQCSEKTGNVHFPKPEH